jgi:hypothetical protein
MQPRLSRNTTVALGSKVPIRRHAAVGQESLSPSTPDARESGCLKTAKWQSSRERIWLVRKLQLPLDRLEAGLVAQGIQQRISSQVLQTRVPEP